MNESVPVTSGDVTEAQDADVCFCGLPNIFGRLVYPYLDPHCQDLMKSVVAEL